MGCLRVLRLTVKTFVLALIIGIVATIGLAAPAGSQVDQCAPPGLESASALPTNLAAAATGPAADKYTTATVRPLDS
ncbi:amino acid ABC transporter permease, partial [Mycobacterium sp. ITM-2017-0098]